MLPSKLQILYLHRNCTAEAGIGKQLGYLTTRMERHKPGRLQLASQPLSSQFKKLDYSNVSMNSNATNDRQHVTTYSGSHTIQCKLILQDNLSSKIKNDIKGQRY